MPNIKSAKKRVAISEANYERNKAYRSALKTAIKKADAAIDAKAPEAAEAVKVAVVKIDKAANKGLLHKNNAARKKSALVTKLNAKA
ncbi:MAG: 30S ribosomal protein S20 [Clostridia bacterium]|nr:30S ribosomal protein S20 [Clostridia bacterium]